VVEVGGYEKVVDKQAEENSDPKVKQHESSGLLSPKASLYVISGKNKIRGASILSHFQEVFMAPPLS
jgi:hypothetical protein